MRSFVTISGALAGLLAPLSAQAPIQVEKSSGPLRYTIETSAKTESDTVILVDGEEFGGGGRGGRGGFGGGGPTSSTQKLVFVEGKNDDGTTWRKYETVAGTSERAGRDGEPQTTEVEGGLAGKKIILFEDDRGVVAQEEGAEEGAEMNRMMTRGLPVSISFAGITPSKEVNVGDTVEFGAGLMGALKGLNHPVTPAMDPNAFGGRQRGGRGGEGGQGGEGGGRQRGGRGGEGGQGGQGGGRQRGGRGGEGGQGGEGGGRQRGGRGGEGGQGGQGGGRQRGGQGGAGGFRNFRGMRGVNNAAMTYLSNDKLTSKVVGKVVSIEEGIAKLEITGKIVGKGDPAELGMMGGMFGGRGGQRGGRGGQGGGRGGFGGEMEGEADVSVGVAGWLTIDTNSHQLVGMVIEGKIDANVLQAGQRGDREFEMDRKTTGTYRIAVEVAPAK